MRRRFGGHSHTHTTPTRLCSVTRTSRQVILQWDLIDIARPGEEIEVTGIYTTQFDINLNAKTGFPVFATLIEANHVSEPQP
jgi:DNA replicative helicase MCM subunit Mcm2 (Cdc46/Mcm family)